VAADVHTRLDPAHGGARRRRRPGRLRGDVPRPRERFGDPISPEPPFEQATVRLRHLPATDSGGAWAAEHDGAGTMAPYLPSGAYL
jgi:hypothetical protein